MWPRSAGWLIQSTGQGAPTLSTICHKSTKKKKKICFFTLRIHILNWKTNQCTSKNLLNSKQWVFNPFPPQIPKPVATFSPKLATITIVLRVHAVKHLQVKTYSCVLTVSAYLHKWKCGAVTFSFKKYTQTKLVMMQLLHGIIFCSEKRVRIQPLGKTES